MKDSIRRWMGWVVVGLLAGGVRVSAQCWPLPSSISSFKGEPGTLVTINGFNFLSPRVTSVVFNFTPGSIESIRTIAGGQQQIAVRVPVGATIGPILIENACGQTPLGRNFQLPPVVSRFEKVGGTTDADRVRGVPGNLVWISGANFLDTSDSTFRIGVFFNGVRAAIDTLTESAVSVVVPAGAASGPITVTNNAGVFVTSTNFFIPPAVSGFTPRGRVGDSLVITGASFRGVTAVTVGGASASFTVDSPTNITAIVPTNAPASGFLAVESPGGRFVTVSNFVLQPRITGFSPAGGNTGTNVTIRGYGLAGVTSVSFGGIAVSPVSASANQVVATVPLGAGTGPIAVSATAGSDASSDLFYLLPKITSLSANRIQQGQTLVLTGTNFLGVSAVQFGAGRVPATQFTVANNREISVVVPTNAVSGRIWLVNPAGAVEGDSFLTVTGLEPSISGFSPASGQAGSVVSVTGTNLFPFVAVRIGGVAVVQLETNATGLRLTVPAGAVTGRIVVETSAGIAASAAEFLVGTTAEVRAEITSSAATVVPGSEFRLNLRVRNQGPLPAAAVRPFIGLPTQVVFRGTTPSGGTFNRTATGVEFDAGTLAVGSVWTAQVRVSLSSEGLVAFPLSVTTGTPDSVPADNSAAVSVEAVPLRLDFASFDTVLVLSWPSVATNAVLQEATGLTSPDWRPSGLVPVDDGVRLQVTLEATNSLRGFRLVVP